MLSLNNIESNQYLPPLFKEVGKNCAHDLRMFFNAYTCLPNMCRFVADNETGKIYAIFYPNMVETNIYKLEFHCFLTEFSIRRKNDQVRMLKDYISLAFNSGFKIVQTRTGVNNKFIQRIIESAGMVFDHKRLYDTVTPYGRVEDSIVYTLERD